MVHNKAYISHVDLCIVCIALEDHLMHGIVSKFYILYRIFIIITV